MFRLAYVVLFLLLTYQFIVQATNAQNVFHREESCSNCVEGPPKRTLFNIVWGCLSTIIIGAWAVLHPNIPPCEGYLKGALRRLELVLWTIMAPEFISCWALTQRSAAMTVRDVYNEAKGYKEDGIWKTLKGWFLLSKITGAVNPAWTLKHGHLLIMGGIHLVEPGPPEPNGNSETPMGMEHIIINIEPRGTSDKVYTEKGKHPSEINPKPTRGRVTILTLEMLRVLVRDPEFEIQLTEAEIRRTSKGDRLSKAIFILQSSWFILQCIARCVQGLDLTPLELTTLALTILNGITLIFWWDKPLCVKAPVLVYMKRKLTDEERDEDERGNSKRSELDIPAIFGNCLTTIRDIVLCREKGNVFVNWLIVLPYVILIVPLIVLGMAIILTSMDLLGGSTSFPVDATHVPAFYVPEHEHSEFIHMSIIILFGIISNGIHYGNWKLPFPIHYPNLNRPFITHEEQNLVFLGVTIIPLGPVTFGYIVGFTGTILLFTFEDLFALMGISMPALLVVINVCAKLLTLRQSLALLRHLPPSAFIAVDWSRFYSHFL